MKKLFAASLCHMGAHGGGLLLTDDYVVFQTNKLTLPLDLRFIKMPYSGIGGVSSCKALFVFPSLRVDMKDGSSYKYIVFGRDKCKKILEERLSALKNL